MMQARIRGMKLRPIRAAGWTGRHRLDRHRPGRHRLCRHRLLPALACWLLVACAPASRGAEEVEGAGTGPPALPTLAIRVAEDSPLANALEAHRAIARLRDSEQFRFVMGPGATGDFVVEPFLLPLSPATRARLAALPIRVDEQAVELAGRRYAQPMSLAVRLPHEADQPFLVIGNEAEAVIGLMVNTLYFRGQRYDEGKEVAIDYWLDEGPYIARTGRWRVREDGRFEVDPALDEDLIAARDDVWAARRAIAGEHASLRIDPARAADAGIRALARDLDVAAARMAARIPALGDSPLALWVEDDYETLGRYTGTIAPAVVHEHEGSWDVHLIPQPRDGFYLRYATARALVARAGLAVDRPWLGDGAALWLSGDWYGRGFEAWLPLLAACHVLPTTAELLAGERQRDATDVLWAPVAAGVLARLPGKDLRAKLAAAADAEQVAAALAQIARSAADAPPPRPPHAERLDFQAGVSLAMQVGVANGYHAEGYFSVLEHLGGIGVRAVSVMPMASMGAPDQPRMGFMRGGAGSEHDLGMIEGVRRARARGMSVLYKPHIWVSNNSWPGDIAMATEADWATWWASYQRFMMHHAILATFAEAEIFAVGTEMGKTLEREAEWRRLIAGVRRVFPGHLTYAGNWWGDYDRIPFAADLDVVGVDAYFPLSHDADATDADLAAGARQAVARMQAASRQLGKPLLLTEVGFAAQSAAWIAPHEEGTFGRDAASEEDQRRAYSALLGALGRPDWLAGVYPWKVYSNGVPQGSNPAPDFTFLGRAAEAVVAAYLRGELPKAATAAE